MLNILNKHNKHNNLPISIVIKSLTYLSDSDFKQSILINKYINKCLLVEFQKRRLKAHYTKLVNSLINNQQCMSNIRLGKETDDYYLCTSKRDYSRGSSFCRFCNHVNYSRK